MKGVLIASCFAAAIATANAQAGTIDFNLLKGTTYDKYYSSLSYESSGIGLTVTAWSDTGGFSDNRLRTAGIGAWNGLGVCNRDEAIGKQCFGPSHSVDNSGGFGWTDYDMLMLSFSSDVSLAGISLGWTGLDSDMSVLGYTAGSFGGFTTSTTYDDLLETGWSLAGQYADVSKTAVNADKLFASTWLIGAYNPAFSNVGLSLYNDQFKVDGIRVTTVDQAADVPEPATFMLFGLGLAALGLRRIAKRS